MNALIHLRHVLKENKIIADIFVKISVSCFFRRHIPNPNNFGQISKLIKQRGFEYDAFLSSLFFNYENLLSLIKLPDFLAIREQVIDPLMLVVEGLDVFLHRPV